MRHAPAIDPKAVLYVVPCRSQSKRLPGKNWLPLGNWTRLGPRPMIRWTLDLLDELGLRDRTVVVDDAGGLAHREPGRRYEERPGELATDGASTEDVVRWLLGREQAHGAVPVMLLQPTSPLRTAAELLAFLTFAAQDDRAPAVSCTAHGHKADGAYYFARAWDWRRRPRIAGPSETSMQLGVDTDPAIRWWSGACCDVYGNVLRERASTLDIDTPEDLARAERIIGFGRQPSDVWDTEAMAEAGVTR